MTRVETILSVFEMKDSRRKYKILEGLTPEEEQFFCEEWERRNPVNLREMAEAFFIAMGNMAKDINRTTKARSNQTVNF